MRRSKDYYERDWLLKGCRHEVWLKRGDALVKPICSRDFKPIDSRKCTLECPNRVPRNYKTTKRKGKRG